MKSAIAALSLLLTSALPPVAITTKKTAVAATDDIRTSLNKANHIFIYEGLPHQLFESDALKEEKKREDTTMLGGFPFYTPRIEVNGELIGILKKIVAESQNYAEFTGEKRCGGFHPDYALSWTDGTKDYIILFCFGCVETVVVDVRKSYRYNFKRMAELKAQLGQFRSKRPAKEEGEQAAP
jgi:hypothetical protein